MFARNFARLVLLIVLSPNAALALGLGDIHVKSSLDAPLSADIDVVDASSDDLSTLKATLASRDTFTHFGADFPAFLGTVTLTTAKAADGHAVIHVSSSSVADEPFATLLVEADWARGHVVREYTVLLDPPTFAPQGQSNSTVAAPSVESTQRAGNIETGAGAAAGAAAVSDTNASSAATTHPAGSPAAAEAASSATGGAAATSGNEAAGNASAGGADNSANSAANGSTAKAGSYTVRRGDTLSSIAQQTYSGSSRAQRNRALVAIYRANPHAFAGSNMNELLAGRTIALPGDDELVAIGPSEASTEVRSQYESWRNAHGAAASAPGEPASAANGASGQLRLVAPQQPAQEAAQGGVAEAAQEAAPAAAAGPGAGGGAGGGTNGAAGKAANAALQQRVQQLQGQLNDTQRLLQLRDAQLASLQARIAQQAATGANAPAAAAPALPPPPASSTAPSSAGANPAAPAVALPPSAPPATPTSPPVAGTAATAPTPAVPGPTAPQVAPGAGPGATPAHPLKRPVSHPHAAPPPSNPVLDLVREFWYVPAILLLAGIGLLVMRAWRARQADAFDRSLGRLGEPDLEPSAPPSRSDTVPVRTMPSAREEPSYRVEESGTHQRPHFDEEPLEASAATGEHVAVDTSATGEAPVALDQGDPLAEADFHMAYGLYDQAAELVQGAIAREPQRRDLKLKLLEVFFVWGNKDRFLQSAHELAATRAQAPAGEWEKIVIMGRQIAPEDPIFADSRALAGAARGGVDLNLEGGQNRVDFDLLGEPTLNAAEAHVDLDVGTALDHTQAAMAAIDMDKTGESHGLGSVDFVVDGGDMTADETTGTTRNLPGSGAAAATTREMPAMANRAAGDTTRVARTQEMEAPTVEQPQLRRDEHSTIHDKLDAAARQGILASEQTAEIAIDDLGLELGNLDLHEAQAAANGQDAPTVLAPMDAETHQVFARAEEARTQTVRAETLRADSAAQASGGGAQPMRATGTWLFTDTDFASMAPKPASSPEATQRARTELLKPVAPVDSNSTSRLTKLDTADLDLDLSSLDGTGDRETKGIDLHVGAAPDDATQTVRGPAMADVEAAESGLPDLEPVTLSEVGTKLDLARAYMDMGDPEGARSILSEVLSEGSLSQKQEARRLMDALPG